VDEQNGRVQPIDGGVDANIYQGIRDTLAGARAKAFTAINFAMVEAYWEIGRQIEEAVGERAEYGKGLLNFCQFSLLRSLAKVLMRAVCAVCVNFSRRFRFAPRCGTN
jgi:hypothetical protein